MGFPRLILALWLLSTSVSLGAPSNPSEHVVQPGQTLAKIAKRYRVEIDDLCEANDLRRSGKLQPGMRLAIPSDDGSLDYPRHKHDDAAQRAGRANGKRHDLDRRAEADRRPTMRSSFSQYLAKPTRRGWVHVMGHHGDWRGQLVSRTGKLQPKAAAALSRLLAWPRTDFPMDRRLLMLLARVSDAFGGKTLRVVSGYRTTSYVAESKHPLGRACDFHVLGVPNAAVRDFLRTFDNVGVGYYPNSTFVHVDVRDHDSYWVDYAGPGEPPRSRPRRAPRPSDESPNSVARANAALKGSDSEEVNPEAASDMQANAGESRETRDDETSLAHSDATSRAERTSPPNPASKKRLGAAPDPVESESKRLPNAPAPTDPTPAVD